MRQRCKKCRRYIGDPRGVCEVFQDYCSFECAGLPSVPEAYPSFDGLFWLCKKARRGIETSQPKRAYTLAQARAAARQWGGTYYLCRTKGHWHHTKTAKPKVPA